MSKTHFKKAMILAAGLGTRLLPITEKEPKPLVPVLNVANILFSLCTLKRVGIKQAILNLHHLPERIESFLGSGSSFGLELHYSRESLLLGTGGGVKKAQEFFAGEPFILSNCDFISNVDLIGHIKVHVARNSIATMVLWQNPSIQAFYSKVGTDKDDRLCSLPRQQTKVPTRTGLFTGIHLLENDVFKHLKEVPSGINEVLYPALMQETPERVYGSYMQDGYWYDTGELNRFCQTSIALLNALSCQDPFIRTVLKDLLKYQELQPGVWAPAGFKLPSGIRFHPPVVIGQGCRFGEQATVGPFTVLGDQSIVGDRAGVSWFLGLSSCQIPDDRVTSQQLRYREFCMPIHKE